MAPPSQELEPPANPGRFNILTMMDFDGLMALDARLRAVAREKGRAFPELLWSKLRGPILRQGTRAEQREAEGRGCGRFHAVANQLRLFWHQREGPH
jgi:hypothetical protein